MMKPQLVKPHLEKGLRWIGRHEGERPMWSQLLVTIPHSGEWIPPEGAWVEQLPEDLKWMDLDRFVDDLYLPAIEAIGVGALASSVHRYVADLNRLPTDVDLDSVQGSGNASGTFTRGFHWVKTTTGERILPQAMPQEVHRKIVESYSDPFHREIETHVAAMRSRGLAPDSKGNDAEPESVRKIYHLDLHSMPSRGTSLHADPGGERPEICISDFHGRSASKAFLDLVVDAYRKVGFQVAVNNPYFGGRITQHYGQPHRGHETLQIELNRALYMSEDTRERLGGFSEIQQMLLKAWVSLRLPKA